MKIKTKYLKMKYFEFSVPINYDFKNLKGIKIKNAIQSA